MFHHHPLGLAVDLLGSDVAGAVAVGKPAWLVSVGGFSVVAAGLEALVFGVREGGETFGVGEFFEEAFEGDVVGREGGEGEEDGGHLWGILHLLVGDLGFCVSGWGGDGELAEPYAPFG